MIKIFERLKEFSPIKKDKYIDITLPVVINISGGLLNLHISALEDKYILYCPDNVFSEQNCDSEFYFRLFMKEEHNYNYKMQISDGIIYAEYDNEYNVVVAINEFIRFFILLDDYVINNQILGNEDQY